MREGGKINGRRDSSQHDTEGQPAIGAPPQEDRVLHGSKGGRVDGPQGPEAQTLKLPDLKDIESRSISESMQDFRSNPSPSMKDFLIASTI